MSELQKIEFYQSLRNLIVEARRKTWAMANSVMVQTYWHIGRRIVEEEQGGKSPSSVMNFHSKMTPNFSLIKNGNITK